MSIRHEIPRETHVSLNYYLKLADEYSQKLIRATPNGLTLANLTCGLFSLIMSMNGLYRFSALFIILAATCDFFDGRLARTLHITCDIGTQLDSLADVVSFGVAPAILAHSIKHWTFLMIIAFISFPYVLFTNKIKMIIKKNFFFSSSLAGAWRLARSNVHPTRDYFIGLPIPAAGIVVALLALFSFVSPLTMIVLALLMISPLQIPKL
jgi:CDP-diacylglycerol--serine O-phosphatidyltransferase